MEHVLFIIFWLLNSMAIIILGSIFPSNIVLGNWHLTTPEAAIYASFWLTFFVWTMRDYVLVRKVKLDQPFVRFLYYFFLESFGIWLVSRYGKNYTGLGITSFWWAFLIGAVIYIFQSMLWSVVDKKLRD